MGSGREKSEKPILGITMGDPAGIGPEVIAKALAMPAVHRLCRPIVIGSLISHVAIENRIRELELGNRTIRLSPD